MKHWRQYLSSASVMIGVFLLAAIAFAAPSTVATSHSENAGTHDNLSASAIDNEHENEAETAETETESDGPNHGHCVSWVAHQSKTDGYKGSDRGSIVSSVAQQDVSSTKDEASAECKAAYDEARASFSTSTGEDHGQESSESESGESHGKSSSHSHSSEHEHGS